MIASGLEGMASVQGQTRAQLERAAQLYGAVAFLRDAIGAPIPLNERPSYDRDLAATRTALGDAVFEAAWAEGQVMTLEQAVAYALEELLPAHPVAVYTA